MHGPMNVKKKQRIIDCV